MVKSVARKDSMYVAPPLVLPLTDPSAAIHSLPPYHCFRCNLAVLVGGSFGLLPSWTVQWRSRA